MVALNPEAPEFFPSHTNNLQQQLQLLPRPNLTPSIYDPRYPRSHYYYYACSSIPSRQIQPFYYPFIALPPLSFPFNDAAMTNAAPLEGEQTHFHDIKNDPNLAEAHSGLQKEHEEEVPEPKMCGSKGIVQKQVYKAFVSCAARGGRRSDSLRLKGYSRRRKAEENGQLRNVDYWRNRKVFRHPYEQCFIASKNKPCPSLPVRVELNETTVMIRNIPSKYSRDMLVEFLDNHCVKVNLREKEVGNEKGEEFSALAFDFVYLPIDFQSGMNKGYAFVNFTKPEAAWKFLMTASNMKWDHFQSHKIREVVRARVQGKEKLEKHFETMSFPYDSEDVLPVCFSPPRDGVYKGEQRTIGNLMRHQI